MEHSEQFPVNTQPAGLRRGWGAPSTCPLSSERTPLTHASVAHCSLLVNHSMCDLCLYLSGVNGGCLSSTSYRIMASQNAAHLPGVQPCHSPKPSAMWTHLPGAFIWACVLDSEHLFSLCSTPLPRHLWARMGNGSGSQSVMAPSLHPSQFCLLFTRCRWSILLLLGHFQG